MNVKFITQLTTFLIITTITTLIFSAPVTTIAHKQIVKQKTIKIPLYIPENAVITNLNISHQAIDTLVTYTILVPGIPSEVRAVTACNFAGETLMSFRSMVKFNETITDLIIPKKTAIYVCTQKEG